MDTTSNRAARRTWRTRLAGSVVAVLMASASTLLQPAQAHALDTRGSRSELSVGAFVVSSCSVGSKPYEASAQAGSLDVVCREQVAPLVENGPVVVLDSGEQVVVSTVNF